MQVGKHLILDKKTQKLRKFTYQDVTYDSDGWADAEKFKPCNYDLVYIKALNKRKIITAWKTPNSWDGFRLPADGNVLYWKRHH